MLFRSSSSYAACAPVVWGEVRKGGEVVSGREGRGSRVCRCRPPAPPPLAPVPRFGQPSLQHLMRPSCCLPSSPATLHPLHHRCRNSPRQNSGRPGFKLGRPKGGLGEVAGRTGLEHYSRAGRSHAPFCRRESGHEGRNHCVLFPKSQRAGRDRKSVV